MSLSWLEFSTYTGQFSFLHKNCPRRFPLHVLSTVMMTKRHPSWNPLDLVKNFIASFVLIQPCPLFSNNFIHKLHQHTSSINKTHLHHNHNTKQNTNKHVLSNNHAFNILSFLSLHHTHSLHNADQNRPHRFRKLGLQVTTKTSPG